MADETTDGSAFIRITNREIWDGLQDVKDSVTQMDNRMNAILNENVDLRTRVRALELKTYTIMAAFTTFLIGGGLALAKGVV